MFRWFKELFNPALKCARGGHVEHFTDTRQTWRQPEGFDRSHYVAMSCHEERKACERCEEGLTEWEVKSRDGYTGYTWSKDRVDRFNKGEVIVQ